ncbi:MAG: 30S ribosomal protein S7 [Candidatus Bathyarchaeia archaeon]
MPEADEEVRLFGKWSFGDVEVLDPGLKRYLSLRPTFLPRSSGRQEHQPFRKAEVSIVEKLVNQLMRPGLQGGMKTKAIGIVRNALEIVHLRTGKNPIEVLVRAVENAAPAEDVTRVAYGGIVYHRSVDISPMRRVDLAVRFIAEGARKAGRSTAATIDELLADEIILAAEKDSKSYAVSKKEEMERIALASR